MMKFKEDGIGVEDLLKLIPEELLLDLAAETNVDYQVKKLYGRNVFNLLLYALIEKERIGLRGLEDLYGSRKFKTIFNLPASTKSAKYNSFSARLGKMNVRFFEQAYESVYEQCSQLYDESVLSLKYKITRVDSTMVCQSASKLEQGINVGEKKDGKKQIKYTISLTNMFPSSVEVFTQQNCVNENLTIPKAILKVIDKHKDNVFVFDRGVSRREVYCELDKNDCSFVTRLHVNARHVVVEDLNPLSGFVVGNLTVLKDQRVYLYRTGTHVVEHPFRLIQTKSEKNVEYWFLTNRFDLPIEEIIMIYKKRWDIEVFFRFLKQELNFSHLMSVNKNGIKIILYMTLIASMMILIYKRINEFGYKTAKRRFSIELDDIRFDEMRSMVKQFISPNTVFR
jgi:transposase